MGSIRSSDNTPSASKCESIRVILFTAYKLKLDKTTKKHDRTDHTIRTRTKKNAAISKKSDFQQLVTTFHVFHFCVLKQAKEFRLVTFRNY